MHEFLKTTALASTLAGLLAMPVLAADQDRGQQQSQQQQTQDQQGERQDSQLSTDAQGCVNRLQELNDRLVETGYGRAGPSGYGFYGPGYAAAPGDERLGTMTPWGTPSSPAADMQLLMRAGYILAVQEQVKGCQAVVATIEDMGNRYQEALETGEFSADELKTWRREYLGGAVGVADLEQPLTIEQIENADVRNLNDEDLGNVGSVLVGEDGKIRYVVVETGGFLGIGEDEVPVRWEDLKVTASPYQTFILDVSEEAFDNAPRLGDVDLGEESMGEPLAREIDGYWQQNLGG